MKRTVRGLTTVIPVTDGAFPALYSLAPAISSSAGAVVGYLGCRYSSYEAVTSAWAGFWLSAGGAASDPNRHPIRSALTHHLMRLPSSINLAVARAAYCPTAFLGHDRSRRARPRRRVAGCAGAASGRTVMS